MVHTDSFPMKAQEDRVRWGNGQGTGFCYQSSASLPHGTLGEENKASPQSRYTAVTKKGETNLKEVIEKHVNHTLVIEASYIIVMLV